VLTPIRVNPDRWNIAFANNRALLRLNFRSSEADRRSGRREAGHYVFQFQSHHNQFSYT